MAMSREERVALHTNQKRMQFSSEMPNEKTLVEGKPEYRETSKGLYQYVRFNNEVYSQLFTRHTRTLEEQINDTVNNITVNEIAISGTLDVSSGGTGLTTITDGAVMLGSGTGAVNPLAVTTDGAILIGDGAAAPTTYNAFSSSTGTLNVSAGGTGAASLTSNAVLTGNSTSAITAEGNLSFNGSTLAVTGALTTTTTAAVGTDLTVTGGDVILGAVATNGTMTVVDSAASTAGNTLIIGGSDVTAGGGGTANVQGGAVTIKAGTSTGTAVSGSILFQTAPAGSASGTAASDESLATVLTIAGDASSTFTGDVNIGDDLSLTSDSAVFNMGAGNDFTITHDGTTGASLAGTPVSIYSTGNLILDASLDVILDCGASGDDIYFKNNGATRARWGMGTSPSLNVTGAFTLDGSSTMELDAVGVFTVSHNGTDQIVGDTSAHLYLNAYDTTKHTNDYGINNQGNLYMFTTGNADFIQNYTFLSYYHVPSNTGADLYEAYPS